jgi:hypothetical protein
VSYEKIIPKKNKMNEFLLYIAGSDGCLNVTTQYDLFRMVVYYESQLHPLDGNTLAKCFNQTNNHLILHFITNDMGKWPGRAYTTPYRYWKLWNRIKEVLRICYRAYFQTDDDIIWAVPAKVDICDNLPLLSGSEVIEILNKLVKYVNSSELHAIYDLATCHRSLSLNLSLGLGLEAHEMSPKLLAALSTSKVNMFPTFELQNRISEILTRKREEDRRPLGFSRIEM